MQEIENRAKKYAEARDRLRYLCAALNDGVAALQKEHLPGIRKAVARASEAEASLRALIEGAPELFAKPKTVTLHGIKAGYRKEKGKIEFDDAAQVIKLIRKHLPELSDALIITEEKPSKEAINNLTAEQIKKIGVTVTSDTDTVFIKPVDSEVDKLVSGLLKASTEAETD